MSCVSQIFFLKTLHVSGNRPKCCKNKCRTSQPLFPCIRSTLFIQNSIIREECQIVCTLCKSLQTYHNQNKISNHLGRLYLCFRQKSFFLCILFSLLLLSFLSQAHLSNAHREAFTLQQHVFCQYLMSK